MTETNLSIRLSIKDSEVVRRALITLGADGQKALARIEQAAQPVSRLLAVNAVSAAAGGDVGAGQPCRDAGLGPVGAWPTGIAAAAGIGALVLGMGAMLSAASRSIEELDKLKGHFGQAGSQRRAHGRIATPLSSSAFR